MQSSTAFLNAHVMSLAEYLAISRDEASADGHSAFAAALTSLVHGGLESSVLCRHVERC